MAELKIDPGKMPDWGRSDLPAPPPYTGRNILSVIGPGTIALSMAIGSGEWLMGPSASVLYGPAILWVTTVAVILQVIFNQECARYIMYTGETTFSGFMRTSPGPRFWGWVYCILGTLQIGWPGWAAASAATIFAAIAGKLPGGADRGAMLAWGYVSFAGVIFVLCFGGTIERGLEKISTFIVLWIAFFLLAFNLIFVPWGMWWKVFTAPLPIWRDTERCGLAPPGGFCCLLRNGGPGEYIYRELDARQRLWHGQHRGGHSQRSRRKANFPLQNRQHLRPR